MGYKCTRVGGREGIMAIASVRVTKGSEERSFVKFLFDG
jgi:hypothetical protein